MKPLYLVIASLLLLMFAGVSFNWTSPDRPMIVEVLGAIGIFAWLPLLITAIVWVRVSKPGRSSRASEASGATEVTTLQPTAAVPQGSHPRVRGKSGLLTPFRLFLLSIASWLAAFAVLEFGSSEASDAQLFVLALTATTGLITTFTALVWAIFRWRLGK